VQVLHTLYDRFHLDNIEYSTLIAPMFEAQNVSLLRSLYEWSIVGVENMHSPKYVISKKFSEVSSTSPYEYQSVSAANGP
jgi:exportin-5